MYCSNCNTMYSIVHVDMYMCTCIHVHCVRVPFDTFLYHRTPVVAAETSGDMSKGEWVIIMYDNANLF